MTVDRSPSTANPRRDAEFPASVKSISSKLIRDTYICSLKFLIMEYNRIVAVTGLPGLYEVLSSKADGAIVRSLDDKSTKFISSRVHNLSHLESIEIYTVRDNVSLGDVFTAMKTSGTALPDVKDSKALKTYFEATYPDMDFERVYSSDLKKMVKWYEVLTQNEVDFTPRPDEDEEETEEAVEADAPAEEAAAKPKAKAKAKAATAEAAEGEEAPKPKKTRAKAAPAAEEAAGEEGAEGEAKPKRTRKKKDGE